MSFTTNILRMPDRNEYASKDASGGRTITRTAERSSVHEKATRSISDAEKFGWAQMKRWQDSGEVLDSDEGDAGLEIGLQSPHGPAKRARILEPQDSGERLGGEKTPNYAFGKESDQEQAHEGDQIPPTSRDDGERVQTALPGDQEHESIDAAQNFAELEGQTTSDGAENIGAKNLPQSGSQTSHATFEKLPDSNIPRDIDTPHGEPLVEHVKLIIRAISSSRSEGTESSLSSPPALSPIEFHFGGGLPLLGNTRSAQASSNDGAQILGELQDLAEARTTGRRSLRQRKEQQLYPYKFDQIQYRKQCKEGGVRPVRIAEAERRAAETQDYTVEGSGLHPSGPPSEPYSSSPQPNGRGEQDCERRESDLVLGHHGTASPRISPVHPRLALETFPDRAKRRKLQHPKSALNRLSFGRNAANTEDDDFSVPLSPPPTSSQSTYGQPTVRKRPVFLVLGHHDTASPRISPVHPRLALETFPDRAKRRKLQHPKSALNRLSFGRNAANTEDDDFSVPLSPPPTSSQSTYDQPTVRKRPVFKLPRRTRKRQARRVEVEVQQHHARIECSPEDAINYPQATDGGTEAPTLTGLGPFGTQYSTDFDIFPLPLGTYFHSSSFVGSGDFAASLSFAGRDLDQPHGRIRVHVSNDVLDLGVWTEGVASDLTRIPIAVGEALRDACAEQDRNQGLYESVLANVDYLLRSTVRYFTRCLAFLDPVDRQHCAQTLHKLVQDVLDTLSESDGTEGEFREAHMRCLQYTVVLARQTVNLCVQPLLSLATKESSMRLLSTAAHRLARLIIPTRSKDLRVFYLQNRGAARREAGIRDADSPLCAVVIMYHTLQWEGPSSLTFWAVIYQAMAVDTRCLAAVSVLDQAWSDVFTILPALELDKHGILALGSRFQKVDDNWTLVQSLMGRLCEIYSGASSMQMSMMNSYFRANLTRCNNLISRWGWYRCDPVLCTIADFFAGRGLSSLHNEESRGSPRFLGELDSRPSLEIVPDDRSFHLFLKTLCTGLQAMRAHGVYPERKIGAIAYRFIPNHGRTYHKGADVRREDLDALRNHHDLLCTIYYASPPEHRPRVHLVRDLVDHSTSHREVCRLNVRTWANLACFQASTAESAERLVPFCDWYRDFFRVAIGQYRLARTEAEQELAVAQAQAHGQPPAVTVDTAEKSILSNQRQIAATLTDALAAVKRALATASRLDVASNLIQGSAFWDVLELFDAKSRRLTGVFVEALSVIETAIRLDAKFAKTVESQADSAESQDYGDLNALQALAGEQHGGAIAECLHGPLAGLVSNAFGADTAYDDTLLSRLLEVWVELASTLVRNRTKAWSNYINDYNSESWSQLRDTIQRRKYTPLFLARVVDSGSVDTVETGILVSWLESLVEREALLKFQHVLTQSLLQRCDDHPLLSNLPFTYRQTCHITLHDLRQRRLGLISSVLFNMHHDLDNTMHQRPRDLSRVRRQYADMLRRMMQAMKSNYQEIQASRVGDVADSNAQGDYVLFVQQVVSFLQQYATDICPVDRFFTDSTAFPLPAQDPAYVVGRLGRYVSKLAEVRKQKELAVFVQAVSERAAVDGQQEYLAEQFVTASAGTWERGDRSLPTLRHLLVTAIFPPYIDHVFSTTCSWIVALPILQATGRIVDDLLYCVKFEQEASLEAARNTVVTFVHSATRPLRFALANADLLRQPPSLRVLCSLIDAVRQGLTCMRHLDRTTGEHVESPVHAFARTAAGIGRALSRKTADEDDAPMPPINTDPPCHWPDARDFTRRHVGEKQGEWHCQDGSYFMRRGQGAVEVVVPMGEQEEEEARLEEALARFWESYLRIFGRQGADARRRHVDQAADMEEMVV